MKSTKKLAQLLCLIVLFHTICPRPTYAYIDPGSGSYFLQILVASTLGLLYSIRLFWAKIDAFLRGLPLRVAKLMKW
jgi:hypothetical protein